MKERLAVIIMAVNYNTYTEDQLCRLPRLGVNFVRVASAALQTALTEVFKIIAFFIALPGRALRSARHTSYLPCSRDRLSSGAPTVSLTAVEVKLTRGKIPNYSQRRGLAFSNWDCYWPAA